MITKVSSTLNCSVIYSVIQTANTQHLLRSSACRPAFLVLHKRLINKTKITKKKGGAKKKVMLSAN